MNVLSELQPRLHVKKTGTITDPNYNSVGPVFMHILLCVLASWLYKRWRVPGVQLLNRNWFI